MKENHEIKIKEINIVNKDKKQRHIHERNARTKKISVISDSNIHLNFISEEKLNEKGSNNEETLINNLKEKEHKTNSDNDTNIEIYFNNIQKKKEEEEEKEKQLIIIYHKLYGSYKDKKYENLLGEIENIKNLLHKNSNTSFKIYLLKIRCLLKSIKQQYEKLIVFKNEQTNLIELIKKISKIRKEFEILYDFMNPNYTDNYEDFTIVYAKFLFYLAIISKLKEEFIKSMSYITMGVNIIKIYFIRRKIGSNLKIYMLYCELLLLLINYLISDNNYTIAIFYCQALYKVLEASYKIIIKQKLPKKSYKKFVEYTGFNYLFIGVCLEQIDNSIHYEEFCHFAFKQANYFFDKLENKKQIFLFKENNENIPLALSEILIEKYRTLMEQKLPLRNSNTKIIKQKIIKKEKSLDIDFIENMRYEKYKPIENKLYKTILTPGIQNNINKLDNELISVIYKQKDEQNMKPTAISQESKKFLYNLELYNILMSNRLRNYIIKNKNLEFNNPSKEKQSIENLQRYLNKKIKIRDNSDILIDLNSHRNKIKMNDNSDEQKKINLRFLGRNKKKKNSKIILNKNIVVKQFSLNRKMLSSQNFFSPQKESINKSKNDISGKKEKKSFKKFLSGRNSASNLFLSKKFHSQVDASKTLKEEKKLKSDYFKLYKRNLDRCFFDNNNCKTTKNYNLKTTGKKIKWRNNCNFKYSNSYSFLENDFERKYLDKNMLSNRYFKKVAHLDSLLVKELSFQKSMLKLKGNSAKMFFGIHEKDLDFNNNINKIKGIKENAYNTYLILDNKAKEELQKIKLENYNNKNDKANVLDYYQNNIFKMFHKYIQTSKEKAAKKLRIYSENAKNVKQNNEKRLLFLNNGLNELNYVISYKNKELKNLSFSNKFKFIN